MTTLVEQRLTDIDRRATALSFDAQKVRGTLETLYAGQQSQTEALTDRLSAIEWASASSLALNSAYLPEIAASLATSNAVLARIETLLANPRRTAANERLREGFVRISRGHFPEAEAELRAATAAYPYDPEARLALGNVLVRLGRPGEAAPEYWHAWRYNESWELAAGAALMYAAALTESGQRDLARTALEDACKVLPDCPEVWLAAAQAGVPNALSEALRLAPDLILSCGDETTGLADASAQVLNGDLLERSEEAAKRTAEAALKAQALGVNATFEIPPVPARDNPPACLAWCVLANTEVKRSLKAIAEAVTHATPTVPAVSPQKPKPVSKASAWLVAVGASVAVMGFLVLLAFAVGRPWIMGFWPIAVGVVGSVVYKQKVSSSERAAAQRSADDAYQAKLDHEQERARRVAPFQDLLGQVSEIKQSAPTYRLRERRVPRLA